MNKVKIVVAGAAAIASMGIGLAFTAGQANAVPCSGMPRCYATPAPSYVAPTLGSIPPRPVIGR